MTEASSTEPACIFCAAAGGHDDHSGLVLYRTERTFVILNKFPYNNGHLMVVPNHHAGRLAELAPADLTELIELTQTAERVLDAVYHPHGFNMGLNLGKPAGAGVLGHVHMHIVPRWNGDTNFLSVVGETRVLPEELTRTVERLRPAFAALRMR